MKAYYALDVKTKMYAGIYQKKHPFNRAEAITLRSIGWILHSGLKTAFLSLLLVILAIAAKAQSNIQAWYEKGQVWIVWDIDQINPAEVYEIYKSSVPVTSTQQATLLGKLFSWEWSAGAIKDQLNDPNFNWKVPHPNRNGRLQLSTYQGLFVYTPHERDAAFFSVVKSGETLITSGVNETTTILNYDYKPRRDPVTCHKQADKILESGHKVTLWAMWADGREDHWNGRPDFPVMASQHKNGHPSIFFVSEAIGMDTTQGKTIPASLWLHGGGGNAIQSLAEKRPFVNITPHEGILVAHNDDFVRYDYLDAVEDLVDQPSNTWFFGWAKSKDPFDQAGYVVSQQDTIVNYTQRRLEWINEWLIDNYKVDPERIHLNGHSMGSAGATALMKTYPDRYASVTIFNNGLEGHSDSDQGYSLFGHPDWNNPTNLYRRDGTNVQIKQVFNLNDRNGSARDLPLVRMFHGKTDNNGVMMWDAGVVNEYIVADTSGWGMQLYWSERGHGIETGENPNHPDHWTHGELPTEQTIRDNVSYVEARYRNTSFPAFYKHQFDPQAHDPGDGTLGLSGSGGTGDDWGTWGGYHDWDTDSITDEQDLWQVKAWLIDTAVYLNDNSPFDSLMSYLAIRKPHHFTPTEGTLVYWTQTDANTGTILKEGSTTVGQDDIVAIDSVILYQYPRKVEITFTLLPPLSRSSLGVAEPDVFKIFPNPSHDKLYIQAQGKSDLDQVVKLQDVSGETLLQMTPEETSSVMHVENLKPGLYYLKFQHRTLRFIKK